MIDIGPRLDSRLRAKFDRIDAESPPERLTNFQPTEPRGRHRPINLVVGVAAIAVVAGAALAFALELSGHSHPAPLPSPAKSATLPKIPVYSDSFPSWWHVVIPVTRHTGSALLPVFVPEGWQYIQYACVGTGYLQLESTDGTLSKRLKPCSNSPGIVNAQVSGGVGPLAEGRPVILKVVTGASVRWEIVVAETAPPLILPTLPPLPANATVLVPLTYGEGVGSLPSFTPRDSNQMEWWCSGPGGYQIFVSNGDESQGGSTCGGAPSSGGGGTDLYRGPRETWVVDVSPHNTWEIRVYWVPSGSSG